ncbi:MAG: hypothetical protein L0170_08260 [Acidobacteria bacterium]|nr:hypothetical protein [Acidobacteriota bacterium]
MKLTAYTRRLEECRKRWHCRTVQYVLEAALILRAARKAAKDERRWGRWIREEIHMNRSTVHRYLHVAKFLKSNVALKQQLVSMSIAKIYALSRLKKLQATALIRNGKAESLSDLSFLKLTHRLQPKPVTRAIRPNLMKSLEASLLRLDQSIRRWHHSELEMPASFRARLRSKLHAMERDLDQIGRASAVAM